MTKSGPELKGNNWPALTATLRVLGYSKIAKAINATNPILDPKNTNNKHSNTYLTPTGKLKKNTPLHAQLDLLHWVTVGNYIIDNDKYRPGDESLGEQFHEIFKKLGGVSQ